MSALKSCTRSGGGRRAVTLLLYLGLVCPAWAQHTPSPHHEHAASAQPREPIPPLTDADRAAAFPDLAVHLTHGQGIHHFLQMRELEAGRTDGATALSWEGRYWAGTDIDRLWLRSQGERIDGRTESADLEVLYGRGISAWWELVAGIRHDFHPGPSRTFAAIGVQGLAPYEVEIEATAYFGETGQTAARLEAKYELLLTPRLILQPLLEAELYGKDDPERGIASGLSTLEAGLRLRHELTRRFAPYVGVVYERAFARTADLRRAAGEDAEDTRIVAGVWWWF